MTLIKTPQHWLPRLVDTLLTLVAWAGFIYLVVEGVVMLLASGWHGPRLEWGSQLLRTMDTLLIYIVCSLLIGVVLLGWAKYNQVRAARYERRLRMPDLSRQALSCSFNVSVETLSRLHSSQVVTLHNDELGSLVWVELPAELETVLE